VALLISVAFWTWLWGPLGLLMATPLTVCLIVLGKHVPGLTFLGTLMSDAPPLAADYGYYQRLLARDPGEAADLIEKHIKNEPWGTVYDALLLPALNYAERDRMENQLSPDEEDAVIEATRELLTDAANSIRRLQPLAIDPTASPVEPLQVLGYAANGPADELALAMLAQSVSDLPIAIEITNTRMQATELVALVRSQGVQVICIADLPPSPSSKSRYLIKRLHDAFPELRILVGRWSPLALADESTQALKDAGATMVAETLVETREYLEALVAASGIRDQGSGIRDQGSGIRDQGSGIGDQGSGIGDQGSGIGDRGSGIGDQGSGIGDQGSGIGDRGSGTRDRGAGSRDQGARRGVTSVSRRFR
jgi:hypothetical protein